MITWARTLNSKAFAWHAVKSTSGGSMATYCHGRWELAEPHETTEMPIVGDCCRTCLRKVAT